jgi:radical SAM superfamily enzyme YgiQ (UPF0313 family)
MRVALVQAPVWWTVDPPLGLAQMAGCLKAAGHDVRVWDVNIRLWKDRLPQYENMWLWEQYHFWNREDVVARFFDDNRAAVDGFLEEVLRSDAGVVGFSIYAGSQIASLRLAAELKARDPRRQVVFGGQFFFLGDKAEEMMRHPQVDAVVRGSGDEVFPGLVRDIERTGRPARRAGVLFRDGGTLVDGGPTPPIRNLDAVPFADFTGFPMELYEDQTRIPVAGSRGCVWACRFCSTREFWPNYSFMSGDRIFAEVLHQKSLFPHRAHFEFYDITANGRPDALLRFASLAKDFIVQDRPERNFRWKINAILRPEMTADYLRTLYEGGCQDIIYGVESGSPGVLRRMNKNYNVEVAERVLRDTHAAGIHTTGNFMFGFPGETEADFRMTLDFLERNHRWLERAYGSATFTSLEEYSYLTDHQEEFGIRPETDRTAHNLYWESDGGANTYPVRLDRYKRFRETCIRLGIDAYKGVNGTLEQDHLSNLAQYHQYKDERLPAVRAYLAYLETDLLNEPIRGQLQVYQKDLFLLCKASRLVDKANFRLASLDGDLPSVLSGLQGKAVAGRVLAVPPPPPPASAGSAGALWAERYLARAQRFLDRLKHRGSLGQEGAAFRIRWEKDALPPTEELDRLRKRVDTILEVAERENTRAVGPRHMPDCAR